MMLIPLPLCRTLEPSTLISVILMACSGRPCEEDSESPIAEMGELRVTEKGVEHRTESRPSSSSKEGGSIRHIGCAKKEKRGVSGCKS